MPTIVGRHPERARIAECLDTGRSSSRLFLILGEAGAGKTTLLAETVERARSSGITVLSGAATRLSEDVPFAAMLPVIRRVVRRRQLAAFLGTESLPVAAMYEAVIEGCERLAARGPVLISVEDLHWSDTASVDLLSVLAVAAVPGVTLAVTVRDDEAPGIPKIARFVADITRLPGTEEFRLGPLSETEAAELVRAAGFSDVAAVLAGTDRIPLLVEEAIRRSIEGMAPLAGHAAEILADRVSQLDSAALDLVNIIAVRGRPTGLDLAGAVLGRKPSGLETPADRARAKAVLVDTGKGLDFRHALFGETWRDRMLTDQRREWHRRIATALEREAGADPAEIAAHWHEAGDLDRTFGHAVAAARVAWRSQSKGDTLSMVEIALGTGVVDDSVATRYDLLTLAATCAHAIGEYPRAVAHALEALDLAATVEEEIAAHDLLGWLYFRYSKSTEARKAFTTAAGLISHTTPRALEARVLSGNVMIQFWETDSEEGLAALGRMADRASQLAADSGDLRAIALAAAASAAAEPDLANVPGKFIGATEAAELADDSITWSFTALMVVITFFDSSRLRESAAWGERLVRRSLARGQLSDHAVLQALTGDAHLELGDTDRAEELLASATRRPLRGRSLFLVQAQRAWAALFAGQYEEAEQIVRTLDGVVLDVPEDLSNRVVLTDVEAGVALARRRPLEAAGLTIGAPGREYMSMYPRALAEAALAIRAGAPASQLLQRSIETELAAFGPPTGMSAPNAAQARAEVSRVSDPSPEPWAEAAKRWDDVGGRRPAAYCRMRQCEALLSTGHPRGECRRIWEEARAEAEAMRYVMLVGELDELAERAGFVERLRVELPLSARELEVLKRVAAGCTNKQIGMELFISAKTAGAHVSNILAKLGVARRIDAAAVAHRLGLFTGPE